jgi:hypothetical protein
MIIHIDDKTRIRGTEHCWQIETLRKTKDGERWQAIKYYTTLGIALQEAAQREIRLAPATGITEAMDACNRVAEKYSRIFDDVGKTPGGAR